MHTNRVIRLACIALLAPSLGCAANVYKCKGAKGETIYQNLPCPAGAKTIATGHYEKAPDNPQQYYAAEADHQQRQEREQAEAKAVFAAPVYSGQRDAMSDAASVASHDSRSSAARAARSAAHPIEEYEAARKRWGSRVAGLPPPGYTAAVAASPQAAAETPAPVIAKPHVYTTDCQQVGYTIHCNNSDGSSSFGSVDPYGNGNVSNADGSQQTAIHRDAFTGASKTDNGTCVRDVYGQCQ